MLVSFVILMETATLDKPLGVKAFGIFFEQNLIGSSRGCMNWNTLIEIPGNAVNARVDSFFDQMVSGDPIEAKITSHFVYFKNAALHLLLAVLLTNYINRSSILAYAGYYHYKITNIIRQFVKAKAGHALIQRMFIQ